MSAKASTPTGRWGGFMKASTYNGLVIVDIAASERDCAAANGDATSDLPNSKQQSTSVKASTPTGRWRNF